MSKLLVVSPPRPLEESDLILSKEVFKDGVRLRYELPLPDLPSSCVCGDKFTVEHVLSCNKGSFISLGP